MTSGGLLGKRFYNVMLRRSRNSFVVSASSEDGPLVAVNRGLQRIKLPTVVSLDCVISRAIVQEGDWGGIVLISPLNRPKIRAGVQTDAESPP